MAFKRHSTVEIAAVYNRPSDIMRLAMDWQTVVKRGGTFCPDGACPFVPGEKFDYDLSNFLYYRARAITADIANLNGDMFPHPELKTSYNTFVGKGVYFNHDSDKPEKAFGIILDAVYTPVHFGQDDYADKYVELLCAIDRKAINTLRPGLLGDIETGKVTSTSMGTIAQRAQCSVCGNMATNMEQLCLHVHPQSPLYCKGRDVYGKKCFETNFGLSFIEDSIVYIPADGTARMLEVYAALHSGYIDRMATLFEKYALAAGRPVKRGSIELSSNFRTTGGFMPTAAPAPVPAPAPAPAPAAAKPGAPAPGAPGAGSPAQEAINELPQGVQEAAQKLFETKFRRMIEEELRKMFGPMLESLDKTYRGPVAEQVKQQFDAVKQQLGDVAPEVAKAPEGPAAAAEDKGAPAGAPKPPAAPEAPAAPGAEKEAAMQYPLAFIEDFATWKHEDKQKLVQAIASGKPWEFKGVLEFPVKEA